MIRERVQRLEGQYPVLARRISETAAIIFTSSTLLEERI